MSEKFLRDNHLTLIESGVTILFYFTMMSGAALTSYGVYLNATQPFPVKFLLGLATIGGAYLIIIGMSTVSQNAYSNLYDDFYKPRGVKLQEDDDWIKVTARRIPNGTAIILAEESESNIANYANGPREFRSSEQEFKLKEDYSGVKLKNDKHVEIFRDKELDDMNLYLYRNSPQCRWVGETIRVNI